jgi:DNA gyrase subunit A
VLDVALSDGKAEIMILSRDGRAIRFPEDQVSVLGRTAQGVKGIELRGDDRVVGMLLVRREAQVLTVSDDGVGKRTPVDEFPLQKRGGLGTLAVPSGEEARPLVSALEVVDGEEVMVVTAAGRVHRVPAGDVPIQRRRSRGRKMVSLGGGDRVVEVTRASGAPGEARASPPGGDKADGQGAASGGRAQIDLLG